MDSSKKPAEGQAKKNAIVAAIVVAAIVVAALVWWGLHGTVAAVLRWVAASTAAKALVVFAAALVAAIVAHVRRTDRIAELREFTYEHRYRPTHPADEDAVKASARRAARVGNVAAAVAVALFVAAIVAGFAGGQARGVATAAATVRTDTATGSYEYRLPWSVAAASARSKAGKVVGEIANADTTFLPGTMAYTTPVKRKSPTGGYTAVVVQNADGSSTTCSFTEPVPSDGGAFGFNLRRAVSFVDMDLGYAAEDLWAYCDGGAAKLVVPVTRFVGFPEGHQVPAGVVVFDGATVDHVRNVDEGELPGPVYPMSLARAQRESLANLDGWWERMRGRAGYGTTGIEGSDPNAGNETELLLAQKDGSADYVTPLTPKGGSGSVVAVAAVAADRVRYGVLNEIVVHELVEPRVGNGTVDAQVRAAFPELGWAAGLRLAEVLPLSAGSWNGTITTDLAAVNRVTVAADGTVCLTDMTGLTTLKCSKGGSASDTGVANGIPAGDLVDLTDAELLELQRQVTDEVARRLNK